MNNEGYEVRAMKALARADGLPIAGKGGTLTATASNQTVTLEGDAVYAIYSADAIYIGQATTATASNRLRINVMAGGVWFVQTPAAGLTLHYSRVGTDDVAVEYAKLDDQV